jgi:hypothetical protein
VSKPDRPKDVTVFVPEFAAYFAKEPCWGVLHVSLDDANYSHDIDPAWFEGPLWNERPTDEERRLIEIHNSLSPTQRCKLGRLASAYKVPR